jgi:putative endonuclease
LEKRKLGNLGEKLAEKFLRKNKYKIIERNFRSRFGEIDIIALEAGCLVFLEVKTRWSKEFGPPEEALTNWKIRRIIKTAEHYKGLHPELPEASRVDVVAIEMPDKVRLIKNITG